MHLASSKKIVGLCPAAGRGTRLGSLAFSKELFPIAFAQSPDKQRSVRAQVVSEYFFSLLRFAQVNRAAMVISPEKVDILRYFQSGETIGMNLCYLVQNTKLKGMPFALDCAYEWVGDATVAFGMPDTLIRPENAFVQLLDYHVAQSCDLTLGLFKTNTPQKYGMVDFDADTGIVHSIIDKPSNTKLDHLWGIACWEPSFGGLLRRYVEAYVQNGTGTEEMVLGSVFSKALETGLRVRAVPLINASYNDIGTVEELLALMQEVESI